MCLVAGADFGAVVGLLVETDDFAAAAWVMAGDVGDPLSDALFRVVAALGGCAGMAGSDPSGVAWGRWYDDAAGQALTGLRALTNGGYRVSAMFGQTCRNYAAAEQASTPDRWAARSAGLDVAQLPGQNTVTWEVRVPSAVGASAGGPPGWSLIMAAVGRVWPGGHQDRLHQAAAAWRSAAAAIDAAADRVRTVPGLLAADRVPEAGDIAQGCTALTGTGQRLATAMQALATHCDDLAARLDRLHSEVAHELASLLGQSIIIEGLGAAASFVSFGTAEGAAQAVEGWRVSAIAARVAELIDTFTAGAELVRTALTRVCDLASSVSRGLGELLTPRLAIADLTPVPTLPEQLSTVNGITRTE